MPRRVTPAQDSEAAAAAPPAPVQRARSVGNATINEVARQSGVSKKTVSRVINHSPLVRPDTRDKVEAVMKGLGYMPDPMARGLAFRRSFLIGMVYDNPSAQYVVNMQNGALESLRGSGFELVVHPCDSLRDDYIAGVRRFVTQQRLHGVILVPRVSEDQALVDMLDEVGCRYTRIAAVALDRPERMVATNDRQGAIEVAQYLQSLGHRRVALITGPRRYLSTRERGDGFLQTMARGGIEVPPELVLEGGYTFESGVACAEKLLAMTPRPTAIFALNDDMAAGVYKTALRLGLSIPGDLSIVGFDDSPMASRLWPSMSTVRLPIRDMGMTAAAMLTADDSAPRTAHSISPHLIVRESCSSPSAG